MIRAARFVIVLVAACRRERTGPVNEILSDRKLESRAREISRLRSWCQEPSMSNFEHAWHAICGYWSASGSRPATAIPRCSTHVVARYGRVRAAQAEMSWRTADPVKRRFRLILLDCWPFGFLVLAPARLGNLIGKCAG